jgi:hypothetical protein
MSCEFNFSFYQESGYTSLDVRHCAECPEHVKPVRSQWLKFDFGAPMMLKSINTVLNPSGVVCENVEFSVQYLRESNSFHDEYMKTAPRLDELEIRDLRLMWVAIAEEHSAFKELELEEKHNLRRAERRLKWFRELAAFRKQEEEDNVPLVRRLVVAGGTGLCPYNTRCHLMFSVEEADRLIDDICGICRGTLAGGEVHKLPCGHIYHGRCIAPWLAEHANCPYCRGSWKVIELPSFNDPRYHVARTTPHPHLLRQTSGFVEFSRRMKENYSENDLIPYDEYPTEDWVVITYDATHAQVDEDGFSGSEDYDDSTEDGEDFIDMTNVFALEPLDDNDPTEDGF